MYSRGPQSSQSVPRSHWAPMAPAAWPSWQRPLPTCSGPPFPKGLLHVFSQSIGGGGDAGGEDVALVVVAHARSMATSSGAGDDGKGAAPTDSSAQTRARYLSRRGPIAW